MEQPLYEGDLKWLGTLPTGLTYIANYKFACKFGEVKTRESGVTEVATKILRSEYRDIIKEPWWLYGYYEYG